MTPWRNHRFPGERRGCPTVRPRAPGPPQGLTLPLTPLRARSPEDGLCPAHTRCHRATGLGWHPLCFLRMRNGGQGILCRQRPGPGLEPGSPPVPARPRWLSQDIGTTGGSGDRGAGGHTPWPLGSPPPMTVAGLAGHGPALQRRPGLGTVPWPQGGLTTWARAGAPALGNTGRRLCGG